MTVQNSAIIIIIVVAFAFYLVYSQNNQPKYIQPPPQISPFNPQLMQSAQPMQPIPSHSAQCPTCQKHEQKNHQPVPQITNVSIDHDTDPYSDPIKKQDLYTMYDPLTYPQLRLPREILEKYNEYQERNGSYPPFGQATQPLFDNPILNGLLVKQVDENEPFSDNVPSALPLFKVKSNKNTNRFFYYTIDQRHFSKIELKIPLEHVKVNNIRHNHADFNGLPELYDGDIIEHIAIYPTSKFKVQLYKTYTFP